MTTRDDAVQNLDWSEDTPDSLYHEEEAADGCEQYADVLASSEGDDSWDVIEEARDDSWDFVEEAPVESDDTEDETRASAAVEWGKLPEDLRSKVSQHTWAGLSQAHRRTLVATYLRFKELGVWDQVTKVVGVHEKPAKLIRVPLVGMFEPPGSTAALAYEARNGRALVNALVLSKKFAVDGKWANYFHSHQTGIREWSGGASFHVSVGPGDKFDVHIDRISQQTSKPHESGRATIDPQGAAKHFTREVLPQILRDLGLPPLIFSASFFPADKKDAIVGRVGGQVTVGIELRGPVDRPRPPLTRSAPPEGDPVPPATMERILASVAKVTTPDELVSLHRPIDSFATPTVVAEGIAHRIMAAARTFESRILVDLGATYKDLPLAERKRVIEVMERIANAVHAAMTAAHKADAKASPDVSGVSAITVMLGAPTQGETFSLSKGPAGAESDAEEPEAADVEDYDFSDDELEEGRLEYETEPDAPPIGDDEAEGTDMPAEDGQDSERDAASLPFLLAGPIVRRADRDFVHLWFACREEVTRCTPTLIPYDDKGRPNGVYPLAPSGWDVVRLGAHLWAVMVTVRPVPPLPPDVIFGYDLEIEYKTPAGKATRKLSELGLSLAYPPFKHPTFLLARGHRRLAHGSCRNPGGPGPDAFPAFDQWLGKRATSVSQRPSALILTGDQIYADDVVLSLFRAVQKLAGEVCGYVELLPRDSGTPVRADSYVYGAGQGNTRKALTGRDWSPIGFTTEDGEGHLLTFPEYAAMYLLIWNPDLCRDYGVDDGSENLKGFPAAVAASRRVLANMATYMLFDDHEITDDWNLDAHWEKATRNAMAQRVIANGLAAYWAFQGWGNDPGLRISLAKVVSNHLAAMRKKNGIPGAEAPTFDKELLQTHWSFVAPTNPPALCVDIRTKRQDPPQDGSKVRSAILSGPLVWPFLKQLAEGHKLRRGQPLLIVLPTPLLPHRALMTGQEHQHPWPRERYQGDYEFYGNYPRQRADLIWFLRELLDPPSIVVFSGDVHHGSVIDGLYVHGRSRDAINRGQGEWAIRVAQVTSSPIKNIKKKVFVDKSKLALLRTDKGNIGESVLLLFENQYADFGANSVLGMCADARKLAGPLGRETYVHDNHLCVVDVGAKLDVLFVGVKRDGKPAEASMSMDLANKPSEFRPPLPKPLNHPLLRPNVKLVQWLLGESDEEGEEEATQDPLTQEQPGETEANTP